MLALLCWIAWRLGNRLWRLSGAARNTSHGPQIEVEFYRRLEALLANRGLVRRTGQTQREFADSAGSALAAVSGETGLELMPLCVAEAFYRVRFGRLPLDNDQAQAVEQALDRIAACEVAAG